MSGIEAFREGYVDTITRALPEGVLNEGRSIVEAHKPRTLELADFRPVAQRFHPDIERAIQRYKDTKAIEKAFVEGKMSPEEVQKALRELDGVPNDTTPTIETK